MARTKLLKSAGRFGVRYGIGPKRKIAAIEAKQRKKQGCIFCNGNVKRIAKGIWSCKKCKKRFAEHAYFLETSQQIENKRLKQEKIPIKVIDTTTKPLKKQPSRDNKEKTKNKKKDKEEKNKE